MLVSRTRLVAVTLSVVFALCQALPASADIVVGSGDVDPDNDDLCLVFIVDKATTQTLAAGQYQATQFGYRFSDYVGTGFHIHANGEITPFLATASGGNYTPIAVGATVTSTSPGSDVFTSSAFGGSNTFTLAASTTVYAGFLSPVRVNTDVSNGDGCPIGWTVAGSIDGRYQLTGTMPGLVLGTAYTDGTAFSDTRHYPFSVTVAPIPEPSTFALLGAGLIGLLAYAWRKRK